MADNYIYSKELVDRTARELNIADLENASIGEVLLLASQLEQQTGIPFIRMDQGSPGFPPCAIGIEAEKLALDSGVAAMYPAAAGIPVLKNEASRFVKAFMDIGIAPAGCVPTTGAVAASFGSFVVCTQLYPHRNKILFIDPGFPIQKSQLRIFGAEHQQFDIHDYRGPGLRAKLESFFAQGDIAAVVYSNPNNPAWISLTEDELQTIGELATQHDVIVLEDLAYFGMDFRIDFGRPFEPPFVPTVARYTDNYILMISSSKIFSYAGQRIALACISDKLFARRYENLAVRYSNSGLFGETFINPIMYNVTSGVTHTTQYGLAAMLRAASDGAYCFTAATAEYGRRARVMKETFEKYGFRVVYDRDIDRPIGDGFFFTIGYPGMSSGELMRELLHYGISSISLATTGSKQDGIRACTSRFDNRAAELLEERLKAFKNDH